MGNNNNLGISNIHDNLKTLPTIKENIICIQPDW